MTYNDFKAIYAYHCRTWGPQAEVQEAVKFFLGTLRKAVMDSRVVNRH